MATSAGHRHPDCNVLNFSYEKRDDSYVTVLVNSVRFLIIAEGRKLQAESGPGAKLAREYRDLLAAVKIEENDFTKPCSRENLRTRKGSKESDSQNSSDNDSAIDVKGPKEQTSSFLKQADSDPSGAMSEWILRPFESIFERNAPLSDKKNDQNLEEWYSGATAFYSLFLDEDGSLVANEEEATPELERRIADIVPKMYVPKWIRQLDIPWYAAKDAIVLRESDEIPPFHPSQVRIGDQTYFLKMVDPTQPQPTRREIDYLKRVEKAGLHKQFRIPLVKGLIGFENSKTEMMGFIETEIEDPTPLTHLLDEEVPQEKRDKWAKESKHIIDILHENNIVWGDAKADNYMVDKHDNLWIIDFGGSYTDGWIDPELMETEAGDNMGVERIVNALHDPVANTFDPTDRTMSAMDAEAAAGNKRKVGKLDEDSVHTDEQGSSESPPKKRVRQEPSSAPEESRINDEANEKQDNKDGAASDEVVNEEEEGKEDDDDIDDEAEKYCYCQEPSNDDMVGCDNDDCERQWYHFKCVGLKAAPKAKHWYCKECSGE